MDSPETSVRTMLTTIFPLYLFKDYDVIYLVNVVCVCPCVV